MKVYTDGSCLGNPGHGGWACIFQNEEQICGSETHTTNNRMELTAVIRALEHATDVTVYTDSRYVKDGIEKWIINWKRNGWKTASGEPVKNQDLWRRLDAVRTGETQFQWVKAHATDEMNLRVDALARKCAVNLLG